MFGRFVVLTITFLVVLTTASMGQSVLRYRCSDDRCCYPDGRCFSRHVLEGQLPRSLTAVPLALLRQPFLAPAPRPPIRALLDLIGFLTLLADPNPALQVLTFEPTLLVVAPRLQLLRVLAPPLYLVPTLQ